MARPITPTPKLNVRESEAFLAMVKRDLEKPLKLISTPRLKEALEILNSNAKPPKR
jgi:hypothetical protein